MKKTILALPVAALVAVGFVACSDAPTGLAPDGPNFELVDEGLRISHDDATHFVFAAFVYEPNGGEGTVLTGGVAGNPPPGIVPGNQKHLGTCHDGTWHNPAGRPTTGTAERPHPFCYVPDAGGIKVVLERIAAIYQEKTDQDGSITHKFLFFTNELDEDNNSVKVITSNTNMQGSGLIEARAVNDDTGELVGHIEFDLEQFKLGNRTTDLFVCNLDSEDPHQDGCLNKHIEITYKPIIGQDELGPLFGDDVDFDEDDNVFLFWVKKADVLGT